MGKIYKLFVINPGSTSTRVACYENEKEIHSKKIQHPTEVIASFREINDQFDMRKTLVDEYMKEIGITDLDVIVSRGGGGRPIQCGGYGITNLMVEECKRAPWPHASNLGVMIAYALMEEYHIPGYIYDAPLADDFIEYAKVSGLPELPIQRGAGHPLNEKAAGHTVAGKLGGRYEDYNFIICHLGGGITVNAHEKGKIIDSHINAFSPERAGALPMIGFTKKCYSGEWTFSECTKRQMGGGGLVAYLGTSDMLEVERRIESGDQEAEFYFGAMIYQIAKDIGGMATVMNGQVDRIILTGEIARSKLLTDGLSERVRFIAPVEIVPGAVEMEALVAGTLRILRGEEEAKDYDNEEDRSRIIIK
ncbi:putative butyrate kinase [Clostridia bacterium]|nr:putative butyrate kinase [Clostridia bacterium]